MVSVEELADGGLLVPDCTIAYSARDCRASLQADFRSRGVSQSDSSSPPPASCPSDQGATTFMLSSADLFMAEAAGLALAHDWFGCGQRPLVLAGSVR